jgi:hypothetical protein
VASPRPAPAPLPRRTPLPASAAPELEVVEETVAPADEPLLPVHDDELPSSELDPEQPK